MDMCMTVAKKLSAALRAHGEAVRYLVFGALTTLLNMALYALFQAWIGYQAANSWGNVLDNALCILFAYATNRRFVFGSRTRGRAAVQEFGRFVACRLGTMLLDAGVMVAGGNWLAPQGQALVLAVLGPWLRASDGVILGVGGSVAYGAEQAALALWGLGVKVFSNLLVIVLNYLFSKLLIFQKNNGAAPLDGNSKKRR